MISKQETLNLSPYMALYDLIIPQNNILRQIKEIVDFSFIIEEFKIIARNRYKIEAKNSELKNAHGYHTAKSKGLFGMEIQSATTIFTVNLKRILKLLSEKE